MLKTYTKLFDNYMRKIILTASLFLTSLLLSAQVVSYQKLDSLSLAISQIQLTANDLVYNDGKHDYKLSFPEHNFKLFFSTGKATKIVHKTQGDKEYIALTEEIDLAKVDEVYLTKYPGTAGVLRMGFPEGVKTQIYTNGQYTSTIREYYLEFFFDRKGKSHQALLTQLADLFASLKLGKKIAAEQFALAENGAQNVAQAEPVDVIVAKHIEALGGAEQLNSITSLKTEGIIRTQGIDIPTTTWYVHNKSMRMDMFIQGRANTTIATANGSWTLFPIQGHKKPVNADAQTAREAAEELDLTSELFNYKAKGHRAELLGKEVKAGNECYKIRLTRNTGTIVLLFIDANTFYINQRILSKKMGGTNVEVTEIMSGFRKNAAGYVYAGKFQYQPAMMEFTCNKYEINAAVDASLFEKP